MRGHGFPAETQRRRDKRREPNASSKAAPEVSSSLRRGWVFPSCHLSRTCHSLFSVFSALVSASLRLCGELTILACIVTAQQQQIPHAGYAYPAGGRQGATFEITVGGQFLDGVKSALVSGAGVEATVVEHVKPLTPAQAGELRDQVKELSAKPNPTEEDRKKIVEIRAKLAGFMGRSITPAIAETVRLNIAVAPGAALGQRQLRLLTPNGLTNPVMFSVGQLLEVSRPPAKGAGVRTAAQAGRGQARPTPESPTEIALPVLVNGQITPDAIDRYRFQAAKGQHIVVAAKAREQLPYISEIGRASCRARV